MTADAGVFNSTEAAARAAERLRALLGRKRVLLIRSDDRQLLERLSITEDLPPPLIGPMAGGFTAVFAAAMVFNHWRGAGGGFWTALAASLVAAVLAGAGAWRLGGLADRKAYRGLPVDELFVYRDALRQGKTVLLVYARDAAQRGEAARILKESGAESVDWARKQWWLGLRAARKARYGGPQDRPKAA